MIRRAKRRNLRSWMRPLPYTRAVIRASRASSLTSTPTSTCIPIPTRAVPYPTPLFPTDFDGEPGDEAEEDDADDDECDDDGC